MLKPKTLSALAVLFASIAVLVGAGVASAAQITGVVVDRNARSHTFVIADGQGRLREIHNKLNKLTPALGRRVTVVANKLRNGTWSATRVRVGRVVRSVRINGTVTYVSTGKNIFVVSARGVSLALRGRYRVWGEATGMKSFEVGMKSFTAALGGGLPAVGSKVTVTSDFNRGHVDASKVVDQGQNTNGIDLEGRVLALDTTARTLTVSSDDSEHSTGSITVDVPASFDMTLYHVGDRVELIASLNPDGTYTLEQSSEDGNANQANNGGGEQGDGQGDQHASAASLCQAQENDPNFAATHNGATFAQYYSVDPAKADGAFGHCVDAMSGDHGATSAEAQCFAQRSDPNFPTSHNGESFLQFYSTASGQSSPGEAFGHCIGAMHQADESQGGSDGSGNGHGSGSGGSGSGGSGSGGSGN